MYLYFFLSFSSHHFLSFPSHMDLREKITSVDTPEIRINTQVTYT